MTGRRMGSRRTTGVEQAAAIVATSDLQRCEDHSKYRQEYKDDAWYITDPLLASGPSQIVSK